MAKDDEKLKMRYAAALILAGLAFLSYAINQPILGGALLGLAGVQLPTGDFLNKVAQ